MQTWFSDNTKGYTKVAEVDVNIFNEAYELTNNIDGSWSRGPEFDMLVIRLSTTTMIKIKVTADLPINGKTGEVMGLRSTSSGDVIYDGNQSGF